MKPYTVSIDIRKPREELVALFNSQENLFCWQTGLQSFEHVGGEPGQVGATSVLVFQHGRTRIELTETITHVNLPEEFDGLYEWSGGMNTLVNPVFRSRSVYDAMGEHMLV